jgi:hypothetical protein
MKKIINISLLLIIVTLFSCSDKYAPIGKWDDCIKLSTKSVELKASADSVTITTGGSWWWITGISINGEDFYDFRDINLESDSYSINYNGVTVEKRNKQTLFIKVEENPLETKRIIRIGLEDGDYFDGVIITQKAK